MTRCFQSAADAFPPTGLSEILAAVFFVIAIAGVSLDYKGEINLRFQMYAPMTLYLSGFFVAFGLRNMIARMTLEAIIGTFALAIRPYTHMEPAP